MIMTVAMKFGKHQALFDELTARLNAVAKENEKLKPYAELGRLSIKTHVCCYQYGSPSCLSCESCKEHGRQEFCAKRAEMEGETP